MKHTSAISAKELETEIKELEEKIYNQKLGSDNCEFMQLKVLTSRFLYITKPLNKHPTTNTSQNLY